MIKPSTTRVLSGLLALGVVAAALDGVVLIPSAHSRTTSAVELRLRRSPGRVDVEIAGLGTTVRAVSQNQSDGRWSARLTGVDLGDRPFTPQQKLLQSSELLSVRLEPLDGDLQLIVKARMGERVPKPTIGSNGRSLVVSFDGLRGPDVRSSGRLDLRRPGRVAQPVMAPPMRPRAVAPPLGDMAVGTMLINNRSFVQASGPPVSLTLNNAPAKDALMSLARLGGYGFVFVGGDDFSSGDAADSSQYLVTMAFRNERYDRALNSVLMSSGLQGRLDGKTLLVGTAVSAKSFGPQMSKVFRLNQVDVASASAYLGNLGALIQVTNTTTTTSRESETSGTSSNSSESTTSTTSKTNVVDAYGSGIGPLLGLVGTTDSRLNTITLVGDPKLISVAEKYLRQIDLRKRQVAVKVQILNVRLENDASIDSSFSAKIGDTFIVSESGNAHMNFGKYKPGGSAGTGVFTGKNSQTPGVYPDAPTADVARVLSPVVPLAESTQVIQVEDENGNLTGYEVVKKPRLVDGQEVYVPSSNPNEVKDLVPVYDKYGRPKLVPKKELNRYKTNSFYSYIESVVTSSNAKTLAQPTLLVQEGEKATVRSGVSVITGVQKTESANGSTSFSNTRDDAGLTVDLEVEKIDDNGFVTLMLNPTIAVPVSAGVQEGVSISDINERTLKSGRIRLRDRQTLILTGVIQEDDRRLARKWPLLGDLPLIGQLFRSSTNSRLKNELVIIVTPSILDDENGRSYGFGYKSGTSAGRALLQSGS